MLEIVAVEEIVSVKGYETTVGMDDVDARLFDGADIEGVGIEEMDDEDAKNILVAELGGGGDLREAAEKFAKAGGAGFGGMVGGKQFEEAIADARLFLINDGVAGGVDEHIRLDKASERNDLTIDF